MNVLTGTSPRWHFWLLVVLAVGANALTDSSIMDGAEMWGRLSDVLSTGSPRSAGFLAMDLVFIVVLSIVSIRRLNDLNRRRAWVLALFLSIPLDFADARVPSTENVVRVLVAALYLIPAGVMLMLLLGRGRPSVHQSAEPVPAT